MSDNVNITSGISFPGLLFIVFLVLKLCNVINWSWWWVFAPLWGGFAIFLVFVIIGVIIAALYQVFKR